MRSGLVGVVGRPRADIASVYAVATSGGSSRPTYLFFFGEGEGEGELLRAWGDALA
jgi:hypothetical protein